MKPWEAMRHISDCDKVEVRCTVAADFQAFVPVTFDQVYDLIGQAMKFDPTSCDVKIQLVKAGDITTAYVG